MAFQTFTDNPKGDTIKVKAVHLNELKDAINDWSNEYGSLPTVTESDAVIEETIYTDLANDIIDILNTLHSDIQSNPSNCPVGYTGWNTLTNVSSGDYIEALPFNDAVDNMQLIQNKACYNCNTCDAYSPCTCNGTCNGYVPPRCTCNYW